MTKALKHALGRQAFGGQRGPLWKIALAVAELSRSDAAKEALVAAGCPALLSRLLDIPPERQAHTH